jgi:hypothetical protein
MINSVNHPWGISDKSRKRYGDIWADIDFVFADKISAESFKEDPMNTTIGYLQVAGASVKMKYKDLIAYAKSIGELSLNLYKADHDSQFDVDIKTYTVKLRPIEITRLSETLNDSLTTTMRGYELGLYL